MSDRTVAGLERQIEVLEAELDAARAEHRYDDPGRQNATLTTTQRKQWLDADGEETPRARMARMRSRERIVSTVHDLAFLYRAMGQQDLDLIRADPEQVDDAIRFLERVADVQPEAGDE